MNKGSTFLQYTGKSRQLWTKLLPLQWEIHCLTWLLIPYSCLSLIQTFQIVNILSFWKLLKGSAKVLQPGFTPDQIRSASVSSIYLTPCPLDSRALPLFSWLLTTAQRHPVIQISSNTHSEISAHLFFFVVVQRLHDQSIRVRLRISVNRFNYHDRTPEDKKGNDLIVWRTVEQMAGFCTLSRYRFCSFHFMTSVSFYALLCLTKWKPAK